MFHQEATQAGTARQVLFQLEEQGLDVGALPVRSLAGLRVVNGGLGDDAPLEEGKERAVALHEWVMLEHAGHGRLVKGVRTWYDSHDRKLLAASSDNIQCFDYACKLSFCQVCSIPLAC